LTARPQTTKNSDLGFEIQLFDASKINLNTDRYSKPSSNEKPKTDRKGTDPSEYKFSLNKLNPMSKSNSHLKPV
jgi:hypothetical protein